MPSWKATNRVGLLAAKRLTKSVVAVIFLCRVSSVGTKSRSAKQH